MSATTTPAATDTKTQATKRDQITTYAPLAVSVLIIVLFGAAYYIAWKADDKTSMAMFAGGLLVMSKEIVTYWVSGTASSKLKDDRAAEQLGNVTAALAGSAPVVATPAASPAP